MCDVMTALTVGATLYSGYTQRQQANAQGRVARQTANYNARLQENEAQRVRNVGIEEENKQRRMTAEMLSNQRAQLGAAGVQLNTGSALQLQEDTVNLGEVDALRIRRNYADEAKSMEQGAVLTRNEGAQARAGYRASGSAAFTNSVLSAGGTVASKWYSPKSAAVQQSRVPANNVNRIPGGGNIHSQAYLRSQRV